MNFFDRIFKGKVFPDKREATLVCEMRLLGGTYMLDEFDLSYAPENGTMKFSLNAVVAEPINSRLESWISQGNRRTDGEIRFYKNNDAFNEGALFHLRFSDAVCTRFRQTMRGEAAVTDLVIIPRGINLAGEECKIK